jgi:WS/DGAT/MGAT family acyltransferase
VGEEAAREARTVALASRMSDAEALMWIAERDPVLRSSFMNVTICDRPLDIDRFRSRMEVVVDAVPRLRQRVVPSTFGPPSWVEDEGFDLEHHVRHLAVAAPGTTRQLLDLAADLFEDAFDAARPLWTLVVVDGLADGRGALLSKLHHTITDGVGGVRMSAMFIDLTPDQADPTLPADPVTIAPAPSGLLGSAGDVVRRQVDAARSTLSAVLTSAANPAKAVETVRGLIQLDPARSPLWTTKRGVGRRFEVLTVGVDDAKAAAHSRGGTVNDVFVTALAQAAGDHHRAHGIDVADLRMAMPINTRTDKSAGGNSFLPARVLVPCGPMGIDERFARIHDLLAGARHAPSLGLVDAMAGAIANVPEPLLVRLLRQQTDTIDFTGSNVRGAPFDLFIAGAQILHNHPMGPTGGTAFGATVLSTGNNLDLGLVCDTACIDDSEALLACIADAFAALDVTPAA